MPEAMTRSSLSVMRTVVFALLVRELKTRFGRHRLGYAWVILEPLSHAAVFAFIFGFVMKHAMPGIDYVTFLVVGVTGFQMFKNTLNQIMNAVSANAGLFNYGPVHPIDAVIARAILEGLVFIVALPVLLWLLGLIGREVAFSEPLKLFAGAGLLWLFALGVGLFLCVFIGTREEIKKIVGIVLRVLYFGSGVMFSVETIPQPYRDWLLWNPIIHGLDLMRTGLVPGYAPASISAGFLAVAALIALFLGLAAYAPRASQLRTPA